MTDAIHMQQELNKLNERHALLECRLSHLREMAKELASYDGLGLFADKSPENIDASVAWLISESVEEIMHCISAIREREDALEEKRARQ